LDEADVWLATRESSGLLPERHGIGLDQVLSVKPDDNQKVQVQVQKNINSHLDTNMVTQCLLDLTPSKPPLDTERFLAEINTVRRVFSVYDLIPLPTHSSARISSNLSGYETEITLAEFNEERIQTKYKIETYLSTMPPVNNPVTENTAKYKTTTKRKGERF